MIIRRRHNSRFTVVPNAIFEDDRLSIEAKGVLGYLLSRPHDWQIRLAQLQNALQVGRDRLQRIIRELIKAGYVERDDEQPRDDEQKFTSYNYVVRDVPNGSDPAGVASLPQPEKPSTASRGRETRNGTKKEYNQNGVTKSSAPHTLAPSESSEGYRSSEKEYEIAARAGGCRAFVIEHSKPWNAWLAHRRNHGINLPPPRCTSLIEGQPRRGAWLPTLYPPNYRRQPDQPDADRPS